MKNIIGMIFALFGFIGVCLANRILCADQKSVAGWGVGLVDVGLVVEAYKIIYTGFSMAKIM